MCTLARRSTGYAPPTPTHRAASSLLLPTQGLQVMSLLGQTTGAVLQQHVLSCGQCYLAYLARPFSHTWYRLHACSCPSASDSHVQPLCLAPSSPGATAGDIAAAATRAFPTAAATSVNPSFGAVAVGLVADAADATAFPGSGIAVVTNAASSPCRDRTTVAADEDLAAASGSVGSRAPRLASLSYMTTAPAVATLKLAVRTWAHE